MNSSEPVQKTDHPLTTTEFFGKKNNNSGRVFKEIKIKHILYRNLRQFLMSLKQNTLLTLF